jgi:hypothetical protein
MNRPKNLSLGLQGFFSKEKGREPLWLKAFSHFFNTLSDRLVIRGPAFFDAYILGSKNLREKAISAIFLF